MLNNPGTDTEELVLTLEETKAYNELILWNDDVNTFGHVIDTLVELCGHSSEQAEQCAYIVHHKGKCAVKRADFETLSPICIAILDRGISATID